jgi:O-antigen/teichoic acid export membrane protein
VDGPAVDGTASELLRTAEAGGRVVRGGVVRGGGYAVGTLIGVATAALLLRYLNVEDFGIYAAVGAILGIVGGVTDAGLTAVGGRELSVAATREEREALLHNLLALRIVATMVGVVAAVAFTLIAGYEHVAVIGAVVGGAGLVLTSVQSMLTVPLWVELRIVSLTSIELLRNVLTLVGVLVLVVAGASLVAFFAVQVAVGLVLIPVTAWLAHIAIRNARAVRRDVLARLVRETIPLAVAIAMSVIYVRALVVLVSLLSTERETGLFGTSFRIFELLLVTPGIVLSVALPLLSVAGEEDQRRLAYGLQRMTEASLLFSALLAIVIGVLADTGIRLIAGPDYADAAPVLRVQAIALVPMFLVQTWQLGLIAGRAQRAMAFANSVALGVVLVLGIAFIPPWGALGASWAAVAAETALAALLWVALARSRREVVPRFGFAWKVALVAGASAGVGWLLRDLPILGAAAAVLVFAVVAFATNAVPPDIAHALGLSRGGDDE